MKIPDHWSTVGNLAGTSDANIAFWWRKIGQPFAVLLEKAGYPPESQYRNLLFFFFVVLPELGPGPGHDGRPPPWQSFMTDHFSPVEFSWEWSSNAERRPTVRFSIEPIGMFAGTPADPVNGFAAQRMVRAYQPFIPGCDLRWFDHFLQLVSFSTTESKLDMQGHKSRLFVAFDVFEESVMLKAYFLPVFKAAELGTLVRDLISDVVTSLPEYKSSSLTGFDDLSDFLNTTAIGATLVPEIVAVDCVEASSSRIKIYMRSRCTSFCSVRQILSLSDLDEVDSSEELGYKQLKMLWYAVLGLGTDFPEDEELPLQTHRTAGILYYFEVKPGRRRLVSKVYIPVRHYGRSDQAIADGITKYLTWNNPDSPTKQYQEAIQRISSAASVSFGIKHPSAVGMSLSHKENNIAFSDFFLSHWHAFEAAIQSEPAPPISIDGHGLDLATVVAIARYGGAVRVAPSAEKGIKAAEAVVTDSLAKGDVIYGVNTGYGGSADTRTTKLHALQATLIRGLHYGILPPTPVKPSALKGETVSSSPARLGAALPLDNPESASCMPESWVRASMLVRLNSLSSGASGVRMETVETLAELLTKEIVPRIPVHGSISASGDLSPLSYIGGAMQGKPTLLVWSGESRTEPAGSKRKLIRADRALARAGIRPLVLGPKEGLAIVNGTAISTGVAALALHETHCHAALSQVLTAMSVEAILGTDDSFNPFIAEVRPHPGQVDSAKNILAFLSGSRLVFHNDGKESMTLRQDRYSVRTASQWIGPVLEDILLAQEQITIELNSVTDNPLINASGQGTILHGGNFQAKSVTSAIEKARLGLQAIGRMLFTQCTELINPSTNRGLPPNLVVDEPSDSMIWKGTDIYVAALASELGFLANPVGTHVMSAEMGNQALNSLALISARYTLTALDVLSQLAAAYLVALCQALDLRALHHQFVEALRPRFSALVRDAFGPLVNNSPPFNEKVFANLQMAIWDSFLACFKQNMSMDSAPRITKAVDALPSLILPTCPKTIATLNAIESFSVSFTEEAVEQYDRARSAYRAAPDATPLLGAAAKRMYLFVRKTLGVPFFGEAEITTPPPERVEHDAREGKGEEETSDIVHDDMDDEDYHLATPLPPTVGTHISTVYQAIRSGELYAEVAKCFEDATK